MAKVTTEVTWLDHLLLNFVYNQVAGETATGEIIQNTKERVTKEFLNLIELSRDKELPLLWLEGEIRKL